MATDAGTIDYLLDQLGDRSGSARYSTKRMFGEYCLYHDGLPVALLCDDVLFVKDTPAGRSQLRDDPPALGAPYPGAKPHLRLAPDRWEDGDALRRLLDATAAALPPARPRRAQPAGGAKQADAEKRPSAKKRVSTTPAMSEAAEAAEAPRPRGRPRAKP